MGYTHKNVWTIIAYQYALTQQFPIK